MKSRLLFTLPFVLVLTACGTQAIPSSAPGAASPRPMTSATTLPSPTGAPTKIPSKPTALGLPLDRALERVTKKPFGLYVTKADSPVQPERFAGFHVGTDFETFAEEKDDDVAVRAVCEGRLLTKRTATGYGGVAVQSCTLGSQAVTVIYGHVRLSSIATKVGMVLKKGDSLGVLGKGYSTETDGERKHLHLGVHKGTAVNIAGYVQGKSVLRGWLNAVEYMR